MHLFDSHCHLQDSRIVGSIDAIVANSIDVGVEQLLCCGSAEADWSAVLRISQRFPDNVLPAFGFHPWYVASRSTAWLQTLTRLLEEHPAAAVGEIGLDHMVVPRNDTEQLRIFYEQLLLAKKLDRAVSIHCRKAWGTLMELFRREPGIARRSVIHSYGGPSELIGELERLGASLSFSGSITYVNNSRGRRAVGDVDIGHLLIETDSPDLTPLHHIPPNVPGTLPAVLREVAFLRGVSVEEIADATWVNGCRCFGKSSRVAPQGVSQKLSQIPAC